MKLSILINQLFGAIEVKYTDQPTFSRLFVQAKPKTKSELVTLEIINLTDTKSDDNEFVQEFNSRPQLQVEVNQHSKAYKRILRQAEDLFEDKDKALTWLRTPKISLNNRTPVMGMTTDEGSKQVEQMLYQAEYGIYG